MNILFLFDFPILSNTGGVERVTTLLASHFNLLGHSVIYVASDYSGKLKNPKPSTIPQYYLEGNIDDKRSTLIRIIDTHNITHIINQSSMPNTVQLLAGLRSDRLKIVSVLHNRPFAVLGRERKYASLNHSLPSFYRISLLFTQIFPFFYRFLIKRKSSLLYNQVLEVSDKYFMLSERFTYRLMNHSKHISDSSKIDFINNPNTFNPLLQSFINPKEDVIIWVGRLYDPQKNTRDFIDIWKFFQKKHPQWQAIIIGDGPHRDIAERYARKRNVQNLSFIGNQTDIVPYYKRAKFICMTSLYEGWPMVLAEAMAYGCIPFVFNTFESASEIITHGENGILVNPFNISQMVDALSAITADEEKRTDMSEQARKSILQFSIENIAKIWVEKLSRL